MQPLARAGLTETNFKSAQLQYLFRKLFCLISTRLTPLVQHLALHDLSIQKVWEILFELLTEEGRLRLLQNRHLDHLILCSTFGVVKSMNHIHPGTKRLTGPDELLGAYRAVTHCPFVSIDDVNVHDLVKEGEHDRATFLNFYNVHFLPKTWDLITSVLNRQTVSLSGFSIFLILS